jgi:peroxiredoxin
VALYIFREPLREFAYATITEDMFVSVDDDDFDPGPAIGSRFPGIRAVYRSKEVSLLEEFAGSRGTALVASRSFDWCPYCMRQLIQLQAHKPAFDAAGVGLVAITYDAPKLQRIFIDKHGISIPVLSDIDALSFKTLGILNTDYQPGDSQYGIPHPGMIVVDPRGVVVGKLFLEAYSVRVDARSALAYALEVLDDSNGG